MADHNSLRSFRTQSPSARTGAPADGPNPRNGDPLAELARLIGQSDPFAELDRERRPTGGAASGMGQHHTAANYSAFDPDREAYAAPVDSSHTEAYGAQDYYQQNQEPQAWSGYDDPQAQQYSGYAEPGYDAVDGSDGTYAADYAPEPEAFDAQLWQQQEEWRQRHRRRRLATVLAVFGLAVVGSAAAYGYRTLGHGIIRSGPPPIIKADAAPTKVVPVAKVSDAKSKAIYDRVGDRGSSERMVSREEKPLQIKTVAIKPAAPPSYPAGAATGAITPHATQTVPIAPPPGQSPYPASPPSLAMQSATIGAPAIKKIRTVAVRPDMTIVPNAPVASPAQPPSGPAAAPIAPAVALSTTAQPAPTTSAAQRPGAPLALAAPAESRPAPSSAPQTNTRGGYAVQISSQRSEADAQASFRNLQAKYPAVLRGRASFIRRADLGAKGVYYRTMVGPFASADEAAALCGSLKAAGGNCLIQRN